MYPLISHKHCDAKRWPGLWRAARKLCLRLVVMVAAFSFCAAAGAKTLQQSARVSAGQGAMLVIRDDGRAWGWGLNGTPWAEEPKPVCFLGTLENPKPESRFLENIVAVAVGYQFSYLLCADGTLWALGRNDDDRMSLLSDDTGATLVSPLKITNDVAQVAVCGTKTAIVKHDGSLWVWDSKTPPAKLLDAVRSVALSSTHGLALMRNGTLMAWGDNTHGQLGDTAHKSSSTPVPVAKSDTGGFSVVSLAAADGLSIAITADGKLHRWGRAAGAKDPRLFPEQAPQLPLENVRSVALGFESLTLKTDGTLWVSSKDAPPVQVLDNVAEASSGGYGSFLALKTDGSFWVWGTSQGSALGVNSGEDRPHPGRLHFVDAPPLPLTPELLKIVSDRAALPPLPQLKRPIERQSVDGYEEIVLLLHKGVLWESRGWAKSRNFTKVSAGRNPDIMITDSRLDSDWHHVFFENGMLMAKGENHRGQLGDGTTSDRDVPVPVRMPDGIRATPDRVTVIATDYEQSGMIMDGVIWLWGRRGMRESNNSPRAISTPRPLAFAAGDVVDLALGGRAIVILTKDGTLWATGDLSPKGTLEPTKVLGGVRGFASDGSYCIALKEDGSLWGWGRNYDNELSDDKLEEFTEPTLLRWTFEK